MLSLFLRYVLLLGLDTWSQPLGTPFTHLNVAAKHHLQNVVVDTAIIGYDLTLLATVYNRTKVSDLTSPIPAPVMHLLHNHLAVYTFSLLADNLRRPDQVRLSTNVHHVVSVALLLLAYYSRFSHFAILIFAIMGCSTPLLSLSKYYNALENRHRAAILTFASFAVTFFVTRVVLFPLVFMRITLIDAVHYIPKHLYYASNSIIIAIYIIQLVWFKTIIQIIRHKLKKIKTQ